MITRGNRGKEVREEAWTNLAAAIVYRACIDYEDKMTALYLEDRPNIRKFMETHLKAERKFFGSEWYYTLTTINHNIMLAQLEENARERAKKNQRKHKKYKDLWE